MVLGVVPTILLLGTRGTWPAAAPDPLLAASIVAGLLLAGTGLSAMIATIRLFTTVGEGTLAPWDPTRRLVVRGPYRHVRNPMIGGVMAVLLGEAALFGSPHLLLWFLLFAAANALWMPLVEEPGLERRFGEPYRQYRRNVPRWLPRRTPWEP